jgi:hypothetical protein
MVLYDVLYYRFTLFVGDFNESKNLITEHTTEVSDTRGSVTKSILQAQPLRRSSRRKSSLIIRTINRNHRNGIIETKEDEDSSDDIIPTSSATHNDIVNILKSDYLIDDKFGPAEIYNLQMPLPENFPKHAGKAYHALEAQLIDHKTVINEMKKIQLPTQFHEVEIEKKTTFWEKIQDFFRSRQKENNLKNKQQQLQIKIEKQIYEDVEGYVLAQRSYIGTRRMSLHDIHCFQSHYPNPFYPEPAKPLPFPRRSSAAVINVPSSNTKSPSKLGISSLNPFQSSSYSTRIVEPVGRKPRVVGIGGSANVEGGDGQLSESSRIDNHSSSRRDSQLEFRRGSRQENRRNSRTDARRGSQVDGWRQRQSVHFRILNLKRGADVEPEPKHGYNYLPLPKPGYDTSQKLFASKKLVHRYQNLFQFIRRDHEGRRTDRIPEDVFLGRRGSFPILPGLQPNEIAKRAMESLILENPNHPNHNPSDPRDSFNTIIESTISKHTGLIRSFTFQVPTEELLSCH